MLRFEDHRSHIDLILAAVRAAADPRGRTAQGVREHPPRGRRVAVIAVGKAAPAMLQGFRDSWGGEHDAVIVVPPGVAGPDGAIVADHPVPTQRSLRAAQRVAAFVEAAASGATGHDGFVVLLSGGASALLCWPVEGIGVEEYAAATRDMLGLEIRQLNAIRKHCERLKGGRLALTMGGLPCDNYLLSDVIGDDPSTIGSGPTVPDPTTFDEAREPFNYELEFTEAERVLLPHLREGAKRRDAETPKPGDPRLAAVRVGIVGGSAAAVQGACEAAAALGFGVTSYRGVTGEAHWAGTELAREAALLGPPAALVYGGETTVRVGKKRGKGGRNQEVALAAALVIEGRRSIAVATFATDGVDGPTDAAGAVVTGRTCEQGRSAGLDPAQSLADHDSYSFFEALGRAGHPHLIKTGPTGSNVNDIAVALVY